MREYNFERKFKRDKSKNLDLNSLNFKSNFSICLHDDTN